MNGLLVKRPFPGWAPVGEELLRIPTQSPHFLIHGWLLPAGYARLLHGAGSCNGTP